MSACSGDGGSALADCQTQRDCDDVTFACPSCPETAEQMCEEGECIDRADDERTVFANITIEPRQLVVDSLVHSLVSMTTANGAFDCDTHFQNGVLDSSVSAYHSGFKALSGGSYHQEVNVGRSPAVDVALILIGTDTAGGEGETIAAGCYAPIEGSSEDATIELVSLVGLE